ncbi:MAG: thioredoxin family protein [Elusimicrobiales bacterium]|nr:thioredoxin family protein [Elusimicrobiales bacterium]
MMLDYETRDKIKKAFSDLKNRVGIVFFKESLNCSTCKEMEILLEEIKDTLSFIDLEVYNKYLDMQKADEYKVEKTPAVFFKDYLGFKKNLIIYGFTHGYEFITLLEIIKYISGFKIDLEEESMKVLETLNKDVNIKVFVTPTCPYCPSTVLTLAKFSLFSSRINTEIIMVNEFYELATKYGVRGVPKTIVNEKIHLEGARAESDFINAILNS